MDQDHQSSNQAKRPKEPEYATLVRLAEHGQQNKWQTFQMFMVLQTILFTGWINLSRAPSGGSIQSSSTSGFVTAATILLFVFPIIGTLTSVLWGFLGNDYADASDLYSNIAQGYEREFPCELRPLTRRHEEQKRAKGSLVSSRFVIVGIPFFVGIVWFVLLVIELTS